MARKISLALAAAAVLAFAVPAFASAAAGLTQTAGTFIPTGTIITGTNKGAITVTSTKTGNLTCDSVMIEAKLTKNDATAVEAGAGGTSSATKCMKADGTAITVNNISVTNLKSTGGGTGTATVKFEIVIGGLTCKYSTESGKATYNPNEVSGLGGMDLSISKQVLKVEPAACGTTAELDGVFTLTTQNNTAVYLM